MPDQDLRNKFQKRDPKMLAKQFLTSITFNRLDDLHRYVEEIEWKFRADKKRIARRHDEEIAQLGENLDPYQKQLIGEFYGEDYFMVEEIFERQFRYSVLVTFYSILEGALNDLCNQMRHLKKLELKLDDLKGSGVERAELYLRKACLIDFPGKSGEWNEILELNKLRNCIVHTQGNILEAKKTEELKKIIKNTKGLDIERDRYIKIKPAYIESIEESVRNFLTKVFDNAFK